MNPTHPSADTKQVQLRALNQLTPIFQLSPAQLYANLPLGQNRTIRLLDLDGLPSKLDTDETPLVGTLRVVSLSMKPRFTALSYVWGAFSTPHPDTLELRHSGGQNVTLEISTNCRDALRALRRKYGALCIWVDAICINQHNNAEKESQIPLMEDIFSWATVVYAWLGPGTDASDRVMNWVCRVAQFKFLDIASAQYPPTSRNRLRNNLISVYHMLVLYFRATIDVFLGLILSPITYAMLKSGQRVPSYIRRSYSITEHIEQLLGDLVHPDDLYEFSNNEWFWRAWTFQELILAPNVILVCGHHHLEWTRFIAAFKIYSLVGVHSDSIRSPQRISEYRVVPQSMFHLIHIWIHTKRQLEPQGLHYFTYESWLGGDIQKYYALIHFYKCRLLVHLCVAILVASPFLIAFILVRDGMTRRLVIVFTTFMRRTSSTIMLNLTTNGPPPWLLLLESLKANDRGHEKLYLAGIVQAIRTRHTTNDKDRSYAVYGVLQRLGVKELSNPDYSASLDQVYKELVMDLLRYKHALIHLLIDAGISTGIGRPSWVPDLRIVADRQWVRSDYIIKPVERAATPTSSAWVEFGRNDELVVTGIPKGTITFCSARLRRIETTGTDPPGSADMRAATLMLTRWLAGLIREAPNIEAYQPICKAAAKVLAADIDSKIGLDLTGEDFFTWYKVLTCSKLALEERAGPGFEGHGPSPEDSEDNDIGQVYDSHLQGDVAKDMTIKICNHIAGRRNVFITTNGLAGSGPEAMSSGDIVMLIAGIPVPMILRQVVADGGEIRDSLTYRIIGPAFVLGLMKGEGFETDTQTENIILV
ncbi:hypothetical protein K449DRAFT_421695 [Hypoxylon sp. EC38]|nr:hypothetical protein K449DRAFT_421695 [Hypoxylon sp. EC38]